MLRFFEIFQITICLLICCAKLLNRSAIAMLVNYAIPSICDNRNDPCLVRLIILYLYNVYKRSVVKTLLQRVESLPSDIDSQDNERKHARST
jgi:hypothetical protein